MRVEAEAVSERFIVPAAGLQVVDPGLNAGLSHSHSQVQTKTQSEIDIESERDRVGSVVEESAVQRSLLDAVIVPTATALSRDGETSSANKSDKGKTNKESIKEENLIMVVENTRKSEKSVLKDDILKTERKESAGVSMETIGDILRDESFNTLTRVMMRLREKLEEVENYDRCVRGDRFAAVLTLGNA